MPVNPSAFNNPLPAQGRRLGPFLARLGRLGLDTLFPPYCPLCRAPSLPHALCGSCRAELAPPPPGMCRRCGTATARPENGCGGCLGIATAPDAAHFAFAYEEPFSRLIMDFKYHDATHLAALLGRLLVEGCGEALGREGVDAVLPVPLHPWRLLGRRFNQSALIARPLARFLNLPLEAGWLRRVRPTAQQSLLMGTARRENVANAFLARPQVARRRLLLVDDVATTLSTIHWACHALKEAGAARVVIACLARTRKPDT